MKNRWSGSLLFCLIFLKYVKQHSTFNHVTNSAWKVFKYGFSSGPYFPVFGLNTGKYGPEETPYLDTFQTWPCHEFTPYISVFSPNTGKYGPKKSPYFDTFLTWPKWVHRHLHKVPEDLFRPIYINLSRWYWE